jgi:hypothetical protein
MVFVNNNCIISGQCVVPGSPDDQSAYRSELTGLYGIASTIWHLQQTFNVKGNITAGCDGLSALRQAEKRSNFINPNIPQFDLILAIRKVIEHTEWQWKWVHVKGHQDDIKTSDQLDNWSRWNIDMDLQAKTFWALSNKRYINPAIMGEPWRTEIGNRKITSNLRETLREACTVPRASTYWEGKKEIRHLRGNCNRLGSALGSYEIYSDKSSTLGIKNDIRILFNGKNDVSTARKGFGCMSSVRGTRKCGTHLEMST